MNRYLITAPTDPVVSLDAVKAHLRISRDDDSKDELIGIMVGAAVNALDPAGEGWLGRALRPQTWEVRLDGFWDRHLWHHHADLVPCRWRPRDPPPGAIELPYPPLISVDSVNYDDRNDVEQTLVLDTDYRIFGIGSKWHGYIAPMHGGSWPLGVLRDPEAVRVRFTCGYAVGDIDAMPPQIKQAVLLACSNLSALGERSLYLAGEDIPGVSSRRWVVSDAASKAILAAADSLLSNLRVYD